MIEPVEQLSAYSLVVDRLRRAIHLGTFGPGDRLPSERDLAQQLGVSRMTVREAIRVLQTQGYVESRRGATGGLVVIAKQLQGEHLKTQLRDEWKHFEDVLDLRIANERAVARLAAARRDEEDLRKLEESVDQMRSSENLWQFRKADSTFHLAVAGAAKNSLLAKAVEDGRAAMFLPLEPLEYEISVMELLEAHPKILDAIEKQDSDRADDVMTAHLKTTRQRLAAVLGLGGNRY
ncbi:MAG: GntR family transcriptional regulator [Actinomycetota bacterium]|nr:GntR family transcriptional regulator [Actinomycetota bacterium]